MQTSSSYFTHTHDVYSWGEQPNESSPVNSPTERGRELTVTKSNESSPVNSPTKGSRELTFPKAIPKITLCYNSLFGLCRNDSCFRAHDENELVLAPVSRCYKTINCVHARHIKDCQYKTSCFFFHPSSDKVKRNKSGVSVSTYDPTQKKRVVYFKGYFID